jgi:hypothetical protein
VLLGFRHCVHELLTLVGCSIFKAQVLHYLTLEDGANKYIRKRPKLTSNLRRLIFYKNGDVISYSDLGLLYFSAVILDKRPDGTWIRLWQLPSRSLSDHLPTMWHRASVSLDRWASLYEYGNVETLFLCFVGYKSFIWRHIINATWKPNDGIFQPIKTWEEVSGGSERHYI